MNAIVRRALLSFIAAVALLSSSCRTLADYGRVYDDASGEPGVESLSALRARQDDARDERVAVWGARKADEIARCEVLRGQLVHASRAAQTQVWFVWGCPFAWPCDVFSAFIYPIQETQRAAQVLEAARLLEHAYQSDTDTFLRACGQVQKSEVGRAFAPVFAPGAAQRSDASRATDSSSEPGSSSSPDLAPAH